MLRGQSIRQFHLRRRRALGVHPHVFLHHRISTKTVRFVSGMLFAKDDGASMETEARSRNEGYFADLGKELPRTWGVIGEPIGAGILHACLAADWHE